MLILAPIKIEARFHFSLKLFEVNEEHEISHLWLICTFSLVNLHGLLRIVVFCHLFKISFTQLYFKEY